IYVNTSIKCLSRNEYMKEKLFSYNVIPRKEILNHRYLIWI
uniref:N-acetyltransferase n=1 Tax=Meloidogyne hapla TaxID=6305 RepID=A0A1I8BKF0_MELHA